MTHNIKVLQCTIAWALCTGVALAIGPVPDAIAQPVQSTPETIEKIVVTGSAILRTDTETPSPLQIISREEIDRSGHTTVQEVLYSLTANGQGNLNQSFGFAFAAGAAGVALRGLTVGATLVLIDGHRMAAYPISDDGQRSFVDVANIPLAIVERIEVLKDGASAVYGSDAIAGVVNIILKKQFVGSEVSAEYGVSAKNDGAIAHFSGTTGWGDLGKDGHNTYFNIEYRHTNAISLASRPAYANFNYAQAWGPNAPVAPGVVQPGSAFPFAANHYGMVAQFDPTNPATPLGYQQLPGCANPSPLGGCAYDIAQYYQVQPETSNVNVFVRHTLDLGSGWRGTFSGSVFNSRAEQLGPPLSTLFAWATPSGSLVNNGDPTAQPILLPVGNVNNPYPNNPAWLAYLFGDVGPTRIETDTGMYRFVADVHGAMGEWDVDTSVGFINGITNLTYRNFVSYSALAGLIAGNQYGIGASAGLNSTSVYQTLAPTTHATATSNLQYLEVGANRDLMQLSGGPLSIALGAGVRHAGQNFPGQPGFLSGDIIGGTAVYIHGSETSQTLHAEIAAPLLKSVEADAAIRYDNYPATGSKLTPKIGMKWRPAEMLVLRGTYGTGFRAPGPGERGNSGVGYGFALPTDPLRCPVTGQPSDCGGGLVAGSVTGNPALKPETSENYTLGMVFQPVRQASVTVDWFKIRRSNEIIADFYNPVIVRGPVQAAYPTLPGPIVAEIGPYQNLNLDALSGFDIDLQSKFKLGDFGTVSLVATYTHLIRQMVCSPGSGCVDVAGTHGPTGVSGDTGTPRNRGRATLAFSRGPTTVGATVNYVSGYANTDPLFGPDSGCLNPWYTPCKIGSFTDVDIFGQYRFSRQLEVNAHIMNAFNRAAPFDPQAAYGTRNYNNAFAQPGAIGRFCQFGLKYKF